DLRPSEHGLEYQDLSFPPPDTLGGQQLLAFFGTSLPAVELPEAKNISDSLTSPDKTNEISRAAAAAAAAGRHVRSGLLLASAICGLTGVLLLAVSGVVYLLRLR
ncbi:hypothetical protein M569_03768, partial [Genlisea aurea]